MIEADAQPANEPPRRSNRIEIPELLPEDVLADETVGMRPSPEPEQEGALEPVTQARRKAKFRATPGDRDAGPVQVSVLQKRNAYLPPRATNASRNIQDSWGIARRQKVSTTEKAKLKKGFLVS